MRGNKALQRDQQEAQKDPYEVLGVQRTATTEEVKSAFKKLALRFHPDKNYGENSEEAAVRFQEISTAYAILGDPDKRRRYNAGGYASLQPSDLEVQVDLSSLGMLNTAVAAMFSKMGVPIKTSIAPHVLEAAYDGKFKATTLRFGQAIPDKVDKAQAQFYELEVSQAHIDAGFVIGAHSAIGSKFKLLLFEKLPGGQWELLLQEDSSAAPRGLSMAGLYFLGIETFVVGPKPGGLELAEDPEAALFRRLESMQPRENVPITPGKVLVGVYGDNWFKRAQYTVTAVVPEDSLGSTARDDIRQTEARLLEQRAALHAFETEYRQAQRQFQAAVEKYASMSKDVEAMLLERDKKYLDLLTGRALANPKRAANAS